MCEHVSLTMIFNYWSFLPFSLFWRNEHILLPIIPMIPSSLKNKKTKTKTVDMLFQVRHKQCFISCYQSITSLKKLICKNIQTWKKSTNRQRLHKPHFTRYLSDCASPNLPISMSSTNCLNKGAWTNICERMRELRRIHGSNCSLLC